MKLRFFQIAFFFLSFVAVFWSCTSDPSITDLNAIRTPSIATTPVLEISTNTATAGGVLSDNGNSVILSRGVCYSETPNPTIEDIKVVNPGFIGSFDCILTGLTANTQYFVKAYATNAAGTAYGAEVSFITDEFTIVLPVITTTEASLITTTSATTGGNLVSNGGAPIVSRGICWALTPNPTITDNIVPDGLLVNGSFESLLTELSPNTVYYVRAYASNTAGTSYGNLVQFSTLE